MTRLDVGEFEALTFDCYGTLIDWEAGIAGGLRAALGRGAQASDDELLELYARHEAELEAGPYIRYREVLERAGAAVCREFGIEQTAEAVRRFAASVGEWPAFADSADALSRLAERFRLGVITNCDDDLFELSATRLGVRFDWVVTAQQVRAYKPDPAVFRAAFERIEVSRDRILHVAQSLYHDHVPAKRLGLSTVWIDRRHGLAGSGATPPATATPDLTVPDMATFADLALTRAPRRSPPPRSVPCRRRARRRLRWDDSGMDPNEGELRVVDNPAERRYEALVGDRLAGIVMYRLRPGQIVFLHTEVLPIFEGRGIGSRLAAGVLDEARAGRLSVVPRCPFIAAYIRRHPDYASLVATGEASGR